MPQIFFTAEEHEKEVQKWKDHAFALAKLLSKRVSRAEVAPAIGGFGCITEPDAESEYCYGCPAEKHCPYQFKQWPS